MKKKTKRYSGTLDWYFETGSEGIFWVLDPHDNQVGKKNFGLLVFLNIGDHLTVYDEDDSVIFKGKIIPDLTIGWKEYPDNQGHGQPSALGYWIHWTQMDWRPDDWARLFIRDNKPPLRAKLVRYPDYY